jgi:hypothetical protein
VKEADVVVVNADLVWAYNNLFTKDGRGAASTREEENGPGGGGVVEEVKEGVKKLLDPRKAKRMLGKPHSYVCAASSNLRFMMTLADLGALQGVPWRMELCGGSTMLTTTGAHPSRSTGRWTGNCLNYERTTSSWYVSLAVPGTFKLLCHTYMWALYGGGTQHLNRY